MNGLVRNACTIAVASLLSFGCFVREESIEIHEDGSASVTYQVEGGDSELAGGDALPGRLGWAETRERETDPGGEPTTRITWKTRLADLNDYPPTYAAGGDPWAAAYLQMRTTLRVEPDGNRTLFRFERRYIGRRAGKFKNLQELTVPGELVEKAEESDSELTPEEREALFEGLAQYEAMAMLLRARDALGLAVERDLLDGAAFERLKTHLGEFLEQRLTSASLQELFRLPEEEQEAEASRLRGDARSEIEALLPARVRGRVLDLLDLEEKRFEVTEDLGDDSFSLKVALPGIVVSSNSLDAEGGTVTWEFDGEDLSEGDLVLRAVSVLDPSLSLD